MAWWYAALALGFTLLAGVHIVSGDKFWSIAIRLVIACGFGLLSFAEFRGTSANRRPKQDSVHNKDT